MQEEEMFECPKCGAAYHVVRMELPRSVERPNTVPCIKCGWPLAAVSGRFAFKYIRARRGPR